MYDISFDVEKIQSKQKSWLRDDVIKLSNIVNLNTRINNYFSRRLIIV